ncbi:MAG: hypothetical protein WC437_04655 [Patescibacteria group bacterium]|jgi:DNA repair exonuclease SbcCD ATPase subunit
MTQEYPRLIKLENEELKELIVEKGKLIEKGRAKSEEIEKLEIEMAEIEKQLTEEEEKVDLKEFKKREKAITKRMEKCIKDIDQVKKDIYEKIKAETPQSLRDKYDEVRKQKEDLETERNKIALSAQKYNDKIIPLSRDLMGSFLQDEYEDYDTIMVKDGELTATIFSHLDEFKINFNKTKKL